MERRIREIMSKLTIEQKCALLHGVSGMSFGKIPEAGLPEIFCSDGPQGVRLEDGTTTTSLPCGMALAATWNVETAEKYARVIAKESLANDIHVSLGPGVNLMRTPLCGRNFEYYGEDPVLAGKIASGYVRGCQKYGVGATPKHMALNNQEICRTIGNSICSLKTLRELYLEAFEIIIRESSPWLIMSSYNRINGEYASECRYILQEFAKNECGFDGVIVSDWGGVHSAREALRAGTDLEMGGSEKNWMGFPLLDQYYTLKITEEEINEHVRRVIRLILRISNVRKKAENLETLKKEHISVSREIACESSVLLKNRDHILPLDLKKFRNILICGPSADFQHNIGPCEMIGGSGSCHPDHEVTLIESVRRKWGKICNISYFPAIRFADARFFPEKWIKYCSCDYSATAGGEPFYSEKRSDAIFSWRSGGEVAVVEEVNRKFLAEPFYFDVTLKFTVPETQKLDLVLRRTRGVRCDEVILNGKSILSSDRKNPVPFEVLSGKEYTLKISGYRTVKNGGALNILCFDRAGAEFMQQQALDAAAQADCVIYAGGCNHNFDKESLGRGDIMADIPSLEMCDGQSEFLRKLTRINDNVIVALINGSVQDVEPWIEKSAALVEFWYPGQECGDVMTEILSGESVPLGRLPFTWGKKLNDYACHANGNYPGVRGEIDPHVHYDEGIFIGYRHFDRSKIEPRFPFGYGLNYSTMECRMEKVGHSGSITEKNVCVKISGTVSNNGSMPGCEVVQLYLSYPADCPDERPEKVLRNFAKVIALPGESGTFDMELTWRDFAFIDGDDLTLTAVPGEYKLLLGRNAADIFAEIPLSLA